MLIIWMVIAAALSIGAEVLIKHLRANYEITWS